MNVIFIIIFLTSSAVICVKAPQSYLSVLIEGAESCVKTCITLFCIYVVWMGICAVAEDCGITEKLSQKLLPTTSKVFKTSDKKTNKFLATNLVCNFLGFGGAATPYAVKAIDRLREEGNDFAPDLLFVINATSIQLIPATVISLRAAAGSNAPNDIILPSFLASLLSTALAVAIFLLCKKLQAGKLINRKNTKRA